MIENREIFPRFLLAAVPSPTPRKDQSEGAYGRRSMASAGHQVRPKKAYSSFNFTLRAFRRTEWGAKRSEIMTHRFFFEKELCGNVRLTVSGYLF